MILDHFQYMTKVNINVEPEHEDIPSLYWLPKLHKNPYGKRFIAVSNRCTVKRLSSGRRRYGHVPLPGSNFEL